MSIFRDTRVDVQVCYVPRCRPVDIDNFTDYCPSLRISRDFENRLTSITDPAAVLADRHVG